ncbi:chemotaxis protein CheA [Fulvivirgaceae bacterium PWU4]|uniref:Chemotaxis protein CheA n=1 Tax=Chryseosolibacter histidini TaxID=2782349 RepID=A0AAP2DQG7_9BACT|nr:chemotaxis protein CheA [Chryseosolibacter histidini]MBT1700651.1 chemotaxis protein CheA [Chryseosolibacter histidini]
MDNNQKRFIADALDLLNDLDEGLMQLETNPKASAPLEQVFRTMHTIKGGANMFGFAPIGEMAHQLEALFDLVRQGKMQVTDALISVTLQAFDKVRDLLKEKEESKINNAAALKDHLNAAAELVVQHAQADAGMEAVGTTRKDELATYFIRVTPTVPVTGDGNHQLVFIMLDLEALGTAHTRAFQKENNEILHWHQFLATTTSPAEIESFFLFVDHECKYEVTRLSPGNILEDEAFLQCTTAFNENRISWQELMDAAGASAEKLKARETEELGIDDQNASVAKKKSVNDAIIKVSKRKIDDLLNWISELIILQAQLVNVSEASNNVALNGVSEQLEMITNRLRDTSLEIGLVPIETLVTKFKRLVRDLSKSLNKKVNFLSEGADTEMDKDVIEMMAEPMIHLIRNAIDHGIGLPGERKASGKSEYGTVKLKAFNSSTYVNIIISDDGKGIDKDAVLRKAIEKGLTSADAQLTDEEILNLIFHPGLSTAAKVSDVSGRGVGMDAVKQKIYELRGSISIKSEKGKGTSFHIKLPLSRSIIEGMLVSVAETRYVVPLNAIERIDRIPYEALDRQDKVNKTVVVNEQPLPVLSIRKQFHHEENPPKTTDIISVLVNGMRKGIAVDRIEGKMQTVLKPLGDAYQKQDFISGSTILGNGKLALVLDPSRLFSFNHM